MSESIWRDGDTITIEKGAEGWRANLQRGKRPDGSEGGMIGDRLVFHYKTPEEAVATLRKAVAGG